MARVCLTPNVLQVKAARGRKFIGTAYCYAGLSITAHLTDCFYVLSQTAVRQVDEESGCEVLLYNYAVPLHP